AFSTRRALVPLAALSEAAAEIERTGDASRRLPQPAVADEVGALAATLNGMLGSLERAREAERRFVGDASHELRTPLTALRGNADAEAQLALERFWRGDAARTRPGSGLGLAIVRATAERHGGRVVVAGARVAIELPLSTPSQDQDV